MVSIARITPRLSNLIIFSYIVIVLTFALAFGGQTSGDLGNRLVVITYWGDDKVALVDIEGEEGHEELWVIDVYEEGSCAKPYDVKVDRKNKFAYVTCSGSGNIVILDLIARQVFGSIEIGSGASPRDIALTEDGKRAVVANSGIDSISIIDMKEHQVVYSIDVGVQPYGVSLANNDKLALITGWASGNLHFVELGETNGRVVKTIRVGLLPYTVVASQEEGRAYVSVNAEHTVAVVALDAMEVVQSLRVGRAPWGLGLSRDATIGVVANNRSSNATILKETETKGSALSVSQTVNLGHGGRGKSLGVGVARAAKNVAITADNSTAVITDLANNDIVLVDLERLAVTRSIRVGKAPYGIDFLR